MDDLTALALNGSIERWLPVVGFEGFYEVSDHGRVKTLSREVRRTRNGKPERYLTRTRLLRPHSIKPHKGQTWYAIVGLNLPGEPSRLYLVNRLVLEAFVGLAPSGTESCHWDGNGLNNHLGNLRWDTHKNNHQDTVRQGRFWKPYIGVGEDHPNSKLTNSQRAEIRSRVGATLAEMAAEFGVSFQLISQIRRSEVRKAA